MLIVAPPTQRFGGDSGGSACATVNATTRLRNKKQNNRICHHSKNLESPNPQEPEPAPRHAPAERTEQVQPPMESNWSSAGRVVLVLYWGGAACLGCGACGSGEAAQLDGPFVRIRSGHLSR